MSGKRIFINTAASIFFLLILFAFYSVVYLILKLCGVHFEDGYLHFVAKFALIMFAFSGLFSSIKSIWK